jgi:hypothetical protein
MYYFLGFLIFLLFMSMYKEPLVSSPYEMVQEQSGVIQQLHDTILKITLTEAYVDSLQDENDQMITQINQLKQNLPSIAVKDAYPE